MGGEACARIEAREVASPRGQALAQRKQSDFLNPDVRKWRDPYSPPPGFREQSAKLILDAEAALFGGGAAKRLSLARWGGPVTETRKLAAILAADVVGFSRLTSADEDRTLARLRTLRSDLIDPTIAVHKGRVVKRTGDGAIVEFRSVVDAVRCAIEVQNAMVGAQFGSARGPAHRFSNRRSCR